jgi:glycerol-3-phosphate dehydrogenase (NAD(P)+)
LKISVLGSGAFGSAIASRLANNRLLNVTLYGRNEGVVNEINKKHYNRRYLSSLRLSKKLKATSDVRDLVDSDILFLAIPSAEIYNFLSNPDNLEVISSCSQVCNLSKGFMVIDTGFLITDFLRKVLPGSCVLSSAKGPTFSNELITSPYSAFSIASDSKEALLKLKKVMSDSKFSIDVGESIEHIELLSILKNVYAIAISIVDGRFNNPNLNSLVFVNTLLEMKRLSELLLSRNVDVNCYAGVGDLLLTSTNDQSRNRTLGLMLGKRFLRPEDNLNGVVLEGLRSINYIEGLLDRYLDGKTEDNFKILSTLILFLKTDIDVDKFIKRIT